MFFGRRPSSVLWIGACSLACFGSLAFPRAAEDGLRVSYGRDIRPILADRCFKCHGPDAQAREVDLRLDSFEEATADRGGYAAIVPGDPEQSELWYRVSSKNPLERMPPPSSNKRRLSEDELALVREWIEDGAAYEPHWAFVPPSRPALPAVVDEAWCRNEVDRFILARLEEQGLAPSPEADRETLLRRVFLDLTGLPPTPEELDAFLTDEPDGYDRWVEKLLHEEPYVSRYAERMATPWLDAARYADTSGIHMDAGRQIWLWRDWVLAAYRDGMSFERFLTEQLAGDLLPDATPEQQVASGFNRNHVTSDEGGAIDAEYLVEYAVDRAATTGSVFLGLTLGCARCHEHKFDPISQEEFYGFLAFFNSNEEPGVYSQLPDANRALEPFIEVPRPEQAAEIERLRGELGGAKDELERPVPGDDALVASFLAELPFKTGVQWADAEVSGVESTDGSTLELQQDGSVLASGANPDLDTHVLRLRTQATDLRLLLLEGLTDTSLPGGNIGGKVGRAENGNAVLSELEVAAISLTDPAQRIQVPVRWAWAEHEQQDGDFDVANALDGTHERGWAVDGHRSEGGRLALFLSEEPFGFAGGTEIEVRLSYRSIYAKHALGRVRLSLGQIGAEGLAALPLKGSRWYLVGPFPAESGEQAFGTAFGPETEACIDLTHNFGFGNQYWRLGPDYADGRLNSGLPEGVNATFVGKRLFVPSPRKLELSLGSDDGIGVFVDGLEVHRNQVDRSLSADQERITLDLSQGEHALVLKIVNTGGLAGFYARGLPSEGELAGDLVWALADARARSPELDARIGRAWRIAFSPAYRVLTERVTALEQELAAVEASVPRSMVMNELGSPRETFLLMRGQYDRPDPTKPIERGVPAALGKLPDGAPGDRLGLALWMTSEENPVVARVAMNRMWELVFGEGIVRTSEDFGHQGEWPSHRELLDWLAVEFRENGWDVKRMLAKLVTSSTYRQSSRVRPDARATDPENRLIAFFPRKRLAAEAIRDQALFVSGLLVERFGGPSVRPYQPEGLWQEVAMVQSNTREYVRGSADDLWRRSLYTYWKRACPPPALMAFDAPTREFCQIRRPTTNTPLQALVLWNDEQFIEAARVLASRTLMEASDDRSRLARMARRVTGRSLDSEELASLADALATFRARYTTAPEDARKLLEVGEAPLVEGLDPAELAAWTLIANALFSLDAAVTRS